MQQLSAQDAQFLHMETANQLTQVMLVYVYDPSTAPGGKVRFKDIIAHVGERLDASPIFLRKLYRLPLDIDYPYWVNDEHFDLEAHFQHNRLPEPGDWRQFCIHLARHHSRPMDMNRPLWDMLVIEGLDRIEGFAEGSFAIATRTHHAAVDGTSINHFFGALADSDPSGTPLTAMPERPAEVGQRPGVFQMMRRSVVSNLSGPAKIAGTVARYLPHLGSASFNLASGNRDVLGVAVPHTRFNDPVTPHRMFDAHTFRLDDFKRVRLLAPRATINDVVLTTVSGALRVYLEKHDELPDQSLVAVVPVNTRSGAEGSKDSGNDISAMSVKIWTDIADPVARLSAIRDTTIHTKASASGLTARIFMDVAKNLPSAQLAVLTKAMSLPGLTPRLSNVNVSNTPGPREPMYFTGAKITHQYGLAPLAMGTGLFIATPSYNGQISFNITTDRRIMPDVSFFRECLRNAFRELLEVARNATAESPHTDTAGKGPM